MVVVQAVYVPGHVGELEQPRAKRRHSELGHALLVGLEADHLVGWLALIVFWLGFAEYKRAPGNLQILVDGVVKPHLHPNLLFHKAHSCILLDDFIVHRHSLKSVSQILLLDGGSIKSIELPILWSVRIPRYIVVSKELRSHTCPRLR